jgi:hypothetical protein
MTGKIDRVEVITSVQRRRRWSAEEKARIVQETYAPGMSVSLVARQHAHPAFLQSASPSPVNSRTSISARRTESLTDGIVSIKYDTAHGEIAAISEPCGECAATRMD